MTFNSFVATVDISSLGRERDFVRDCRLDPNMPSISNREEFDEYFRTFSTSSAMRKCMEIAWKRYVDASLRSERLVCYGPHRTFISTSSAALQLP